MKQPVRRTSRQTLLDHPRLKLYQDTFRVGRAAEQDYLVADFGDAVFVIAENTAGHIALVQQYRYPVAAETQELIAGMVPAGTDPLAQAQRELHEEANLVAAALTQIGQFWLKPGRAGNIGYVVHARIPDDTTASPANQEADELIRGVQFYSVDEIHRLIGHGQIGDAYSLAALNIFFNRA